jgi:hypothetical protein
MDLDAIKTKEVVLNTSAASGTAINGRRRLLGVQIQVTRGTEEYDIDSPVDKNLIQLSTSDKVRDGGSGEVLFTAMVPRSGDPNYYATQPTNVMLSGRTIVFEDGIWWNAIESDGTSSTSDGGLTASQVRMVIYYV